MAAQSGEPALQEAIAALDNGQINEALRLAAQLRNTAEKFRFLVHARIRRRQPGDLEKAKKELQRWRQLKPADPEPWQRAFEIHLFENDLESASLALKEIERRQPGQSSIHYFNGVLQQLAGHLEAALEAYARAISASESPGREKFSKSIPALRVAAAMQLCDTAAGNYPGSNRVQQQGMFERQKELEILENRLLEWESQEENDEQDIAPDLKKEFSDAWYNLGSAAQAAYTQDDRRLFLFDKAIELDPKNLKARLGKIFSLNYSPELTPEIIYRKHRENGLWLQQEFGGSGPARTVSGQSAGRIRIGYLSSDFRAHSVAHFILPVLQEHNRDRFEVYLYYNHQASDEFTSRFELLADRFRRVQSLPDEGLCQLIRDDRIDILIDLNGLSEHNRIAVLCQRPSPVQINWIGYPNTTGLETVDYRIVDEVTDPPGSASRLNTEKLIHMSNTFSVYQAQKNLPDPGPLPCLRRGYITYGSFNSMPKLNDALLQTWCRLLEKEPTSRILVKNIALGFDEPRRRLLDVFFRFGISPDRVELRGATQGQTEHLQTICEVDISLDSFPYNGTTTTCDCLIMGVPVVTRAGNDHRSRVSASQLGALGLGSLIGEDESGFISIASGLAADQNRLQALRAELPGRMKASPLMDASRFTRELEARLTQAWNEQNNKILK